MRFSHSIAFALAGLLVLTAIAPAFAARADEVRKESFELLNEGVAAVNRGEWGTAVDRLRTVASMALNSFRAHYFLGLALIGDRRHDEAVEALKIALDLDPTHLMAHIALGNAFLHLGDTDEAMAEYFRSLKLRAEYPPALDGIARVYESKGEFDEAVTYFRRAIASNRGYADAYTHLGDFLLRRGRLDEAVELLVEAVTIRPDFGPGLNRLALAYARLGLHNEAVSTIRRAIELEPRSADHKVTLGRIHLELGLMASAERTLNEALEIDPSHPGARETLAEVARRQGDYDEAVVQLEAALADDRLTSLVRRRLEARVTAVKQEQGRFAELEARVASGEAGATDYRALAGIYAARGSWIRAAELQARTEPRGDERQRLAYMLFKASRYRDAHGIYAELAREAASSNLEVNAGVALARLGDDVRAVDAYRRALNLEPGHPLAQLYLANSLLRMGRREEAAAGYKSYLDGGGEGEAAERARRILEQVAPELLPPSDREEAPAAGPDPLGDAPEQETSS